MPPIEIASGWRPKRGRCSVADKQLRVIIVGDAKSVQKAFAETGTAATQAEVKVEGFGKSFAAMGAAFGAGVAVVQTVVPALQGAIDAIGDYNVSVDQSTKLILGYTKSQEAVAAAQAIARREADAGNNTYQESLAALAALTPLARKYGLSLEDVLHTTQLLAASDPVQGFEGAKIAIQEALSGDFTSLARRFELPKNAIQDLKDQGVPNLQIVQKVLADLGIDAQFLATANTSAAKQTEILNGRLTELAATAGQPVFAELLEAITALNKELGKPEVAATIHGIAQELKVIISGRLFEQVGLLAFDAFTGIVGAYNQMLKALSGGHVNIDGLFNEMRAQLARGGQDLIDAANLSVGEPIASAVKGTAPGSPLAPAKLQGYGKDILAHILTGMTGEQRRAVDEIGKIFEGLFKDANDKTDADAFAQANTVLAAALQEVATNGQVTDRTVSALATVYKGSSADVLGLVVAYNQLTTAQQKAKDAADGLATAQYNLQQQQNRAKGDLAQYEAAVTAAQKTAADNAQAAADAIEPLEQELDRLRDAAEASARAGQDALRGLQDELDGLQQAASQHAAAFQDQIDAAQAALQAAHDRRTTNQGLYQAALKGETEEYLRQLDVVDEQTRAIAAKWDAEIGGARRAKEGADDKVRDLRRAANREDLDYLTRIDKARSSGNEKEARRLERELAARQKQRQAATQLAQAQAAVANDEFDATKDRVDKEAQALDEKDAAAEKAAQKNLTAIQAQAKAQADADRAAIQAQQDRIKAVQDQQAADARRSADAQRNIQAEIDKIQAQATAQAKKDKQAIDDANTLLTQQRDYWNVVTTGAQAAVNLTGGMATNAERIATALKSALDDLKDIIQRLKDNPQISLSPNAPPAVNTAPPPGNLDPEFDPGRGSSLPKGTPPPPKPKPPLIDGTGKSVIPDGYHAEAEPSTQTVWFVPNGYTLADYGKQGTGTPQPSTGGPGGLSRVGGGEFAAGSPSFSRAALGGGQGDGGAENWHLHFNFPNVTKIDDPAQIRAAGREMHSIWQEIVRGGRVKRDTGGA